MNLPDPRKYDYIYESVSAVNVHESTPLPRHCFKPKSHPAFKIYNKEKDAHLYFGDQLCLSKKPYPWITKIGGALVEFENGRSVDKNLCLSNDRLGAFVLKNGFIIERETQ